MRHFKLVNSSNKVLDITTTEILFHDIGGLGFEEDNDFRQVGDFWMLNRTGRQQGSIEGSVIFTEEGGTDPYEKYREFFKFISNAPLTMLYSPYGPFEVAIQDGEITVDGSDTYFRTVRVSSLEKSEKNEYGVIDSSITFSPYTPWYTIIKKSYVIEPVDDSESGWIWGDGDTHVPLVFEPTDLENTIPARFRYEAPQNFILEVDEVTDCPTKITIYGPITNPKWTHSVVVNGVSTTISTGAFDDNAQVTINDGEQLVIDSTRGQYAIYRKTVTGNVISLYDSRNFGTKCFVNLKKGENILTVSSDGVTPKRLDIEGHSYYATV